MGLFEIFLPRLNVSLVNKGLLLGKPKRNT